VQVIDRFRLAAILDGPEFPGAAINARLNRAGIIRRQWKLVILMPDRSMEAPYPVTRVQNHVDHKMAIADERKLQPLINPELARRCLLDSAHGRIGHEFTIMREVGHYPENGLRRRRNTAARHDLVEG